jgi:hypothetical protein
MIIQHLKVKPQDILVIEVEIGRLPPSRAQSYIHTISDQLKEKLPDTNILVVPMSDGKSSVNLTLISR